MIEYNLGKVNVVVDALSRKAITDLRAMLARLIEASETSDFRLNSNRVLCFKDRIYMPNDMELRKSILREAHCSPYAIHPGGNKIWEEYIPLAKFAYSRKCRTPLCWTELGEHQVLGPKLVSDIENIVKLIRDHLKKASNWQKLHADLKRKDIEYSEIKERLDLTFEEEPIQIMDRDEKVLGQNHGIEEAIWELEDSIHQQYPHLFESGEDPTEDVPPMH
ncbi:beta-amylase 1, chloroplastic-like [Gossypium australe]|uniref:Beta-amylase 1, chloroplastic-like n=1 Tax=Gossypium australe TaxID=47621 RepID=A0A5B6UZQ4_9ROSI|nr:beta-amylase 1, chloroplastic-like [Gossypium australe]